MKSSWRKMSIGILGALIAAFVLAYMLHSCWTMKFTAHETLVNAAIVDKGVKVGYESNGMLYYTLADAICYPDSDGFHTLYLRRLLSIAASLFTLWGVWNLARQFGSRKLAMFSLFILGTNCFFLGAASYARFYAFCLAFAVWSTWFFLRALQRGGWYWLGYAATLLGCVFSQVTSLAILIVHLGCWWAASSKRWRDVAKFLLCALLALGTFGWLAQRDNRAIKRFSYGDDSLIQICQSQLYWGTTCFNRGYWMKGEAVSALELGESLDFAWHYVWSRQPYMRLLATSAIITWILALACAITSRSRLILGLLSGLLIFAVSDYLCLHYWRNFFNAPNVIFLLPFNCVIWGFVWEKLRYWRYAVLVLLLLVPGTMWWFTFINGEDFDRSFDTFYKAHRYPVICLADRWLSFSYDWCNLPEREKTLLTRAQCLPYLKRDMVLWAEKPTLAYGYLRQITYSPELSGRNLWIIVDPDPNLQHALAYLLDSGRCRALMEDEHQIYYLHFK